MFCAIFLTSGPLFFYFPTVAAFSFSLYFSVTATVMFLHYLALYYHMCSRGWNNYQRRQILNPFLLYSLFSFCYNAVTFTHPYPPFVSLIGRHRFVFFNYYFQTQTRGGLTELGDATPFLYTFAMSLLGIKKRDLCFCFFCFLFLFLFRYNKKEKNSYKRFPL